MGSIFWWNFWNAIVILALVAVVIAVTVWVRRRLRSQEQQSVRTEAPRSED
jgi:heme/copper-type cytochrome/quinol oxidase subunit 2